MLKKKGNYYYGETQNDIKESIINYSKKNGYKAEHFQDAVCLCGNKTFNLELDDDQGVAIRICNKCTNEHPIADSEEYLEEAELQPSICICEEEEFEITVGLALYENSEDVRWLYLGCRCIKCGLVGVYGDWKNEYNGYRELLSKI